MFAIMLALSLGCGTKKLAEVESQFATCEESLTACQARVKSLEDQLSGQVLAKDLAEKRLAAYRDLANQLRDALGSDLDIEIRNGRMVVKLRSDVLFDLGKSALRPEGQATLKKMAPVLKAQDRNFQLAGHTDNQPVSTKNAVFKDNWELSTQRALSAVRFLVSEGVSGSHLAAVGYGENQPVAKNDSDENRQKNRRLELVVMPKLSEIPEMPKGL